jgi:tRNA/tmRNA/rRNA uracil-C5-methylase (TrmA/RlmC/RlmD family)
MSDLRIHVDGPAHGGSCVGRVEGRVVFVRHALPGETVQATATQGGTDSRFWRADATEVLADAHPGRRPSPCPWSGPGLCGGCSWLHATPQLQAQIKATVLTDTLERLGAGGLVRSVGWRAVPPSTRWRTRMTLHTDARGRPGLHGERSNTVVTVGDCLQADPGLDVGGALSRTWPREARIHLSVSQAGRAVVVTDRSGREQVEGPREHRHTVAGHTFVRAVDGFWQAHRQAPELLVAEVARLAAVAPHERVLDLYAGVGLFGVCLGDSAAEVTMVEGHRGSAEFARRNARGASHVSVLTRDAKRWAGGPVSEYDVVVLDPPRAGAGGRVVAAIAAAGPRAVVYVSCEPSTLARDLGVFASHGYRPDHVEGWDLFPGTSHMETVVRLRPG